MPKKVEDALRNHAKKIYKSKEDQDRYVYGTMRRMGWKPKKKKK